LKYFISMPPDKPAAVLVGPRSPLNRTLWHVQGLCQS